MNRLWISVVLSAVISLILALLALFGALAQLLQLSASTSNFLPLGILGNFSTLLYLTSTSVLSAWVSHLILKNIVDNSQPLSLNTIKSYIFMAKDAGLLSESQVKILTECSQYKSNYGILGSGDNEEGCEQQLRDEFQCELELLLNELHRYVYI